MIGDLIKDYNVLACHKMRKPSDMSTLTMHTAESIFSRLIPIVEKALSGV
jgi:hypothetical protein